MLLRKGWTIRDALADQGAPDQYIEYVIKKEQEKKDKCVPKSRTAMCLDEGAVYVKIHGKRWEQTIQQRKIAISRKKYNDKPEIKARHRIQREQKKAVKEKETLALARANLQKHLDGTDIVY